MSQEKTLSVQEALNELKVLDARIQRKISNGNFTAVASGDKIINPTSIRETPDKFSEKSSSEIQSIISLINYRHALKASVLQSNSVTKVTINGKEMTVAQAIDYKTSSESETHLLRTLSNEFALSQKYADNFNAKVDKETLEKENQLLGNDKNAKDSEAVLKVLHEQAEARKAQVLSPKFKDDKSITDYISDKTDELDKFTQQIDFALTASNVTAQIKVEWD